MHRNIEIKARIGSIKEAGTRISSICNVNPETIHQQDIYFKSVHGRLKLRKFLDGKGELIYYDRADANGPRESRYIITPVSHPERLEKSLEQSNGIRGRIKKERLLFLVGKTRIHLDKVEELGKFIELEVVLDQGDTTQDGKQTALEIMDALGIDHAKLIEASYIDLLPTAP